MNSLQNDIIYKKSTPQDSSSIQTSNPAVKRKDIDQRTDELKRQKLEPNDLIQEEPRPLEERRLSKLDELNMREFESLAKTIGSIVYRNFSDMNINDAFEIYRFFNEMMNSYNLISQKPIIPHNSYLGYFRALTKIYISESDKNSDTTSILDQAKAIYQTVPLTTEFAGAHNVYLFLLLKDSNVLKNQDFHDAVNKLNNAKIAITGAALRTMFCRKSSYLLDREFLKLDEQARRMHWSSEIEPLLQNLEKLSSEDKRKTGRNFQDSCSGCLNFLIKVNDPHGIQNLVKTIGGFSYTISEKEFFATFKLFLSNLDLKEALKFYDTILKNKNVEYPFTLDSYFQNILKNYLAGLQVDESKLKMVIETCRDYKKEFPGDLIPFILNESLLIIKKQLSQKDDQQKSCSLSFLLNEITNIKTSIAEYEEKCNQYIKKLDVLKKDSEKNIGYFKDIIHSKKETTKLVNTLKNHSNDPKNEIEYLKAYSTLIQTKFDEKECEIKKESTQNQITLFNEKKSIYERLIVINRQKLLELEKNTDEIKIEIENDKILISSLLELKQEIEQLLLQK